MGRYRCEPVDGPDGYEKMWRLSVAQCGLIIFVTKYLQFVRARRLALPASVLNWYTPLRGMGSGSPGMSIECQRLFSK
jgi:hypothetical protein